MTDDRQAESARYCYGLDGTDSAPPSSKRRRAGAQALTMRSPTKQPDPALSKAA